MKIIPNILIFCIFLLLTTPLVCAKTPIEWNDEGIKLASEGKYENALECFDKAIEINPQYANAWFNKGCILADLNRYEEAIEANDKVIEINPQDADAWDQKGHLLYKLGKYEEAIEAYDKVIEINPQNADAWNDKGATLDDLNRYEEAIDAYNEVIEINPQYVKAWVNKANTLVALDRYEEAINACNRAIEIDSQYANAWVCKGAILADLNRYEEALECFDKALEINPRYANTSYNKGYILYNLGKYEEAIECFNKVLEMNPQDADALYYKGVIYTNLGNYEKAIECFYKVLEINPQDVDAWYYKEALFYMENIKHFPNVSISSTCIYSLDLNCTCELYYIIVYENVDYDYQWKSGTQLPIFRIIVNSFSENQPNVMNVAFQDVDLDNFYKNYSKLESQNDQSYKYGCFIAFSPPKDFTFYKDDSVTITIKIEINNASLQVNDHSKYKFKISKISHSIYGGFFPTENIESFKAIENIGHVRSVETVENVEKVDSFVVRVNLPNDNYFWTEVLHATPNYDYRIPFGRGESLEWVYDSTDKTEDTVIEYRIHPDDLRKSLDEATENSERLGKKSVWLGVLSILLVVWCEDILFLRSWVSRRVMNVYLKITKLMNQKKEDNKRIMKK